MFPFLRTVKDSSNIGLLYKAYYRNNQLRCSSSIKGREYGSSTASDGATASTASVDWRGSQRQQQHYQQLVAQQQELNNKDQQLLTAAARRWQRLWHGPNPHAPKPSEAAYRSTKSKDAVHVVLINLGSPAQPTYGAVWKYLRQFLSDRRIVEIPRLFWLPLLHFLILPTRSRRTAAKYSSIWLSPDGVKEILAAPAALLQQQQHEQEPTILQQQLQDVLQGGAAPPLLVHLLALAARLQQQLNSLQHEQQGMPSFVVSTCVRYGNPSIAAVLQELQQQQPPLKMLLLPLYPQPTASCTASAYDSIFSEIMKWRVMPDLRLVGGFWSNEVYIRSIAESIRKFWKQHGRGDHLLFSYHGIPLKTSRAAGDPYQCFCFQTSRLVAEQLGLQPGEYEVAMQSRIGYAEWTQPYLLPALDSLAKAGCKRVDVVLPGFVSDCLETLEEVRDEAAKHFRAATDGAGELRTVFCLNSTDEAIAVLKSLVLENTQQWMRTSRNGDP